MSGSDPVVTMRHVRTLGFCSRGARAWIQRHNLDWAQFLGGEVRASALEATGDELGIRVAAVARGEEDAGRG